MGRTDETGGQLPTPRQRPGADVVIYDGQCQFCTAQVQRLARWDRKNRLAFLSLHDVEVARRWPDLSHEQLMAQMYIVDQKGNLYAGAAALRYLSRHLPRLWLLSPLLHMPGSLSLWQAVYRWIARKRYRLLGGAKCTDDGACHIHGGS